MYLTSSALIAAFANGWSAKISGTSSFVSAVHVPSTRKRAQRHDSQRGAHRHHDTTARTFAVDEELVEPVDRFVAAKVQQRVGAVDILLRLQRSRRSVHRTELGFEDVEVAHVALRRARTAERQRVRDMQVVQRFADARSRLGHHCAEARAWPLRRSCLLLLLLAELEANAKETQHLLACRGLLCCSWSFAVEAHDAVVRPHVERIVLLLMSAEAKVRIAKRDLPLLQAQSVERALVVPELRLGAVGLCCSRHAVERDRRRQRRRWVRKVVQRLVPHDVTRVALCVRGAWWVDWRCDEALHRCAMDH